MTILNRITKELDSRGLFYKVLLDQRHKKSNNIIILKNGLSARVEEETPGRIEGGLGKAARERIVRRK